MAAKRFYPRLARTLAMAVLCLTASLPAQADWLQYRSGADRNAVVAAELDAPLDRITSLDPGAELRSTPALYGTDLLVGTHLTGALQRIDPNNGERRWQLNAPNWVHSEIMWPGQMGVVGYGNRYFPSDADPGLTNYARGTGESGMLGLDLDSGTVRWRYRTLGGAMPTPVIHNGKVCAATGDRAVHVLDLADGHQPGLIALGSFVSMSSPALDARKRLFVGGGDPYRLFRIDPERRQRVWHSDFPNVIGAIDDVPPAVAGDEVFTTGVVAIATPGRFDHRLYAIDANTGARRWRASPGIGGPVKNNRSGARWWPRTGWWSAVPPALRCRPFRSTVGGAGAWTAGR